METFRQEWQDLSILTKDQVPWVLFRVEFRSMHRLKAVMLEWGQMQWSDQRGNCPQSEQMYCAYLVTHIF